MSKSETLILTGSTNDTMISPGGVGPRSLTKVLSLRISRPTVLLVISLVLNVSMVIPLRLIGSQMYGFFIIFYIWAAMYILLLYSLLYWHRHRGVPLLTTGLQLLFVILLACVVRLVFLGSDDYISLDPLWYVDFGKFMLRDMTPYFEFYFPYPPLFAYFILLISHIWLAVDAFRVLAILLDAGVILMLWSIGRRLIGEAQTSIVTFAYAMLPVSIIESGWNGHFEPLANLFLLLSVWAILQKRSVLAGSSLGLAGATKVYPILIFPVLVFTLSGLRERIKFLGSTLLVALATILPILLWMYGVENGGGSSGDGVPGTNIYVLFNAMTGAIVRLTPESILTAIVALCGLAAGTLVVARGSRAGPSAPAGLAYHWVCLALGGVLIGCGTLAGLYPFLPSSASVYWRYPVDIAIVRGITTISMGMVILLAAARNILNKATVISDTSFYILISAVFLLFGIMLRDVFYGWYLLWSLPLFLLVRDRRLALTTVVALLLLYPSYTYDNFASLGIEEPRAWSEEFNTVDGWSTRVLLSGQEIANSSVTGSITTDGRVGRLIFDASAVDNMTYLHDIEVEFSLPVTFQLGSMNEFAASISAEWDPTFGQYAHIELVCLGRYANGSLFKSTVIFRTSTFTNLTFVLWRYSFSVDLKTGQTATIEQILIIVYPMLPVISAYLVDSLYLTYDSIMTCPYLTTVPPLTILVVAVYLLLRSELYKTSDTLDIASVKSHSDQRVRSNICEGRSRTTTRQ